MRYGTTKGTMQRKKGKFEPRDDYVSATELLHRQRSEARSVALMTAIHVLLIEKFKPESR